MTTEPTPTPLDDALPELRELARRNPVVKLALRRWERGDLSLGAALAWALSGLDGQLLELLRRRAEVTEERANTVVGVPLRKLSPKSGDVLVFTVTDDGAESRVAAETTARHVAAWLKVCRGVEVTWVVLPPAAKVRVMAAKCGASKLTGEWVECEADSPPEKVPHALAANPVARYEVDGVVVAAPLSERDVLRVCGLKPSPEMRAVLDQAPPDQPPDEPLTVGVPR